jgi:hypothetical protein
LAWLKAAPKRHDKEENPLPRLSTLPKNDPLRELPEVDDYLLLCFTLSGMYSTTGFGLTKLSWTEVRNFSLQSGYSLTGWESEVLINMSQSFCGSYAESSKLHTPPPFSTYSKDEDTIAVMRAKVAKQWETFGSKLKTK